MGFPVPFLAWSKKGYKSQVQNLIQSLQEREIPGLTVSKAIYKSSESHIDARELWGGLLLESWFRSLE